MNQEQHKKILQNLTFMKGRLVELDPLIDKLIEKDVFKFEHREQIETYPTAHRQFNEFIKILRASPHKDAFACFIDSLNADGHHTLVQKLESTVPREIGFAKTPGKVVPAEKRPTAQHKVHEPPLPNKLLTSQPIASSSTTPVIREPRRFNYEGTDSTSSIPSKDYDCTEAMGVKDMLEQFQRKQDMILDKRAREMKKEQHEFIQKNEAIVEAYQSQLQQIQKFFGRWENEKQELIKGNKKAADKLYDQMNAFEALKNQYGELKKQYDELKNQYAQLSSRRPKNDERMEVKVDLKREHEDLRNRCSQLADENSMLQHEVESVHVELQEEKEAYQAMEDQSQEWREEEERLKNILREKDRECKRLKDKVEKQQAQIKGLLQKQKEAEYFGPQVMMGDEDQYSMSAESKKESAYVPSKNVAYGLKKKAHKKK